MKSLLLPVALLVACTSVPATAGDFSASRREAIPYDIPQPRSAFAKGTWELSLLGQGYWNFEYESSNNPELNYIVGGARLGYMLSDPQGTGFWSGNNQLLVEGLYADVTDGPGEYIAGANLIIRRNFVRGGSKSTWYVQAGAGAVWSDIYEDLNQTLIGRRCEISLLAGLGFRYQINDRWHFLIEGNYRHISNADTADRNTGLDALGGGIGFGVSF